MTPHWLCVATGARIFKLVYTGRRELYDELKLLVGQLTSLREGVLSVKIPLPSYWMHGQRCVFIHNRQTIEILCASEGLQLTLVVAAQSYTTEVNYSRQLLKLLRQQQQ